MILAVHIAAEMAGLLAAGVSILILAAIALFRK